MKLLFIDCETSGLPANRHISYIQTNMWPNILQISWQCVDSETWSIYKTEDHFVESRGKWNQDAERIHKIPESLIQNFGKSPLEVFTKLENDIRMCDMIIAHNLNFDKNCILAEFKRLYTSELIKNNPLQVWPINKKSLCTMVLTKRFAGSKFPKSNDYKFPKLSELYAKLFGKEYDISGAELHNSSNDVSCLIMCFKQLLTIPDFAHVLST